MKRTVVKIVIIIICFVLIVFNEIYNYEAYETGTSQQSENSFHISNDTQPIATKKFDIVYFIDRYANLAVVLGFAYGIFQYRHSIKMKKVEKAAELSKEFANEFIAIDKTIFNQESWNIIKDKVDFGKIMTFDKRELYKFVPDFIYMQWLTADFDSIYKEIAAKDISEDKKIYLLRIQIKIKSNEVQNIANKLEYFAMYFNSKIAEDLTVYQSLHQIYIDYVEHIYPFIANCNDLEETSTKRLYINTISLYFSWKKRRDNKLRKEKFQKDKKNKNDAKAKMKIESAAITKTKGM